MVFSDRWVYVSWQLWGVGWAKCRGCAYLKPGGSWAPFSGHCLVSDFSALAGGYGEIKLGGAKNLLRFRGRVSQWTVFHYEIKFKNSVFCVVVFLFRSKYLHQSQFSSYSSMHKSQSIVYLFLIFYFHFCRRANWFLCIWT